MAKQYKDILGQPITRRRYGFVVTPLADAMFQLLVFFMLTSSLTPYSLITLKYGNTGSSPLVASGSENSQPLSSDQIVVWQLSRGHVRAKDSEITLDQLEQVLPTMKEAGVEQVLILTTRSATAQGLASALEALTLNEITQVQIVAGQL